MPATVNVTMSILQAIRTFLFYLLLGTSSLLWCSLSFFIAPFLPFKHVTALSTCTGAAAPCG